MNLEMRYAMLRLRRLIMNEWRTPILCHVPKMRLITRWWWWDDVLFGFFILTWVTYHVPCDHMLVDRLFSTPINLWWVMLNDNSMGFGCIWLRWRRLRARRLRKWQSTLICAGSVADSSSSASWLQWCPIVMRMPVRWYEYEWYALLSLSLQAILYPWSWSITLPLFLVVEYSKDGEPMKGAVLDLSVYEWRPLNFVHASDLYYWSQISPKRRNVTPENNNTTIREKVNNVPLSNPGTLDLESLVDQYDTNTILSKDLHRNLVIELIIAKPEASIFVFLSIKWCLWNLFPHVRASMFATCISLNCKLLSVVWYF